MPILRTYFMNRLSDDELQSLLGKRDNFFLENVLNMDRTLQYAQATIAKAGLTSRVVDEPANPFAHLRHDILGAIPLIGPLWVLGLSALRLGQPAADVTLKRTAAQSISVIFSRNARRRNTEAA
ncbi:hypothetical protein J2732_004811 [Achromobacter deleyi]|uniref:hypothetical protein n=1 Tax=Achromobacter deleyi TaxID=1353891 RepID=UPI00285F3CED|nr:hypothetical protein [Achromobacter deleyi]MDR6603790.1 hypothetical protein [Achromobacter deleyi]